MPNFVKSGLANTGSFAKILGSTLATSAFGTVGSIGVMELYKRWQEKKEEEKIKKEMYGGTKPSTSKNFSQVKVDKYGTLADTPNLNIRSPNFNANFDAAQKSIIDDLNNKTKITKGTMSRKKPKSEDKVPLLEDYDAIDFESFSNPQFRMPDFPVKKNNIRSKKAAKALAIAIPSAIGLASLGTLIGTQANKQNNNEKTEEEKDKNEQQKQVNLNLHWN